MDFLWDVFQNQIPGCFFNEKPYFFQKTLVT